MSNVDLAVPASLDAGTAKSTLLMKLNLLQGGKPRSFQTAAGQWTPSLVGARQVRRALRRGRRAHVLCTQTTTRCRGDNASSSEEPPVRELFDDGSKRDGGKECERAHHEDDTDEQSDEHRLVSAERPERGRHDVLGGQGPGQREYRDDDGETPQQQAHRLGDVVEGGVGAEAGEGGTVVVSDRGERVEDLR